MLDIELIRMEPEKIKQGLSAKNVDPQIVDVFLDLDNRWRELTKNTDNLRAQLNALSKERKIDEAKIVKENIKSLEKDLTELERQRTPLLNKFPNLPQTDWPVGKDESDNKVIKTVGGEPKFDFEPKDYLTLAKQLNLIDIERAGKVSGSRFGYLLNEAVLLELALINFAFETLVKKGFQPVIPPVMARPEIIINMGKIKFIENDDLFYLPKDNLYLAATSEHTIGPMHMDEVFAEKELPRRYVGFSTCFRREAGSYGKDTKGILRVHQFDKVEMFSIVKPEDSVKEHEFLLSVEEELMQALKLPYQVVQNCTGDMGWGDTAQYDIETWMPGEPSSTGSDQKTGQYRETQSCSNTTDFQSRGLNIKYKTADGSKYVHTLNGTVFGIGRIIIAIIENYQTKDGEILIPKVLQKYIHLKKLSMPQ
ncbi:MAG: serine--tRNA ligase [bacterium]|nr:serine--tRNA ligase [bacterium]